MQGTCPIKNIIKEHEDEQIQRIISICKQGMLCKRKSESTSQLPDKNDCKILTKKREAKLDARIILGNKIISKHVQEMTMD